MSKAFTKNDASGDLAELMAPRAPLPPDTLNYVTARGLRLLRDELAELEAERADLAAGDDEVRPAALAKLAVRIGEVTGRIASAVLVDPTAQPQDRVRFGARVVVRGLDGADRAYRIVGVDEADVKEGRIAFVAPIARALLGKSVGEVVTFQSPRGAEELELIDVQYDDDP